MQYRQVEPATVPAHELGHMLFERVEESLDDLALARVVTIDEE